MQRLGEQWRRAIRQAVGYDSALYTVTSQAYNWAAIAAAEGPAMAQTLTRLARRQQSADGTAERLSFRNMLHPISVRPGTPDIATVLNTIVRQEYGRFTPRVPPTRMLDCGAYIGDSSSYFLSKYPGLTSVALEPDARNFAMARTNLAPYGARVQLLNKAVASTAGHVQMTGDHDGATVSAVDGPGAHTVEATTVPDLLAQLRWQQIDLLKMDIEGAEADVLGPAADAWLGRVGLLIIELHGPEITAAVKKTLARNGFTATQYRSLWYCSREPLNG
jgi:FkbM family methyltransferase